MEKLRCLSKLTHVQTVLYSSTKFPVSHSRKRKDYVCLVHFLVKGILTCASNRCGICKRVRTLACEDVVRVFFERIQHTMTFGVETLQQPGKEAYFNFEPFGQILIRKTCSSYRRDSIERSKNVWKFQLGEEVIFIADFSHACLSCMRRLLLNLLLFAKTCSVKRSA